MVRERSFACSSARRIGSLRKKVPQVLPRPRNVACGIRFRGICERHSSSAGSAKDIVLPLDPAEEPAEPSSTETRKNLSTFLSQEPAEELLLPLQYPTSPSTRAEKGSSRGRTFVFNLSNTHH